jgi:peptide/nickel transport system permease protein
VPVIPVILGRAALIVPLTLGVATAVFAVFAAAPGDPATLLLGPGVSPEAAERIREVYCLGCPFAERYLRWLGALVRGDLGWSFTHARPVADVLLSALPGTLLLAGSALVLTFTLGTAAGVLQAVRHRSFLDRVLGAVSLIFYSMPSFWLAVMLVLVFSYGARNVWGWPVWFPASGARSLDHELLGPWGRLADTAWHMVLPVLALTLVMGAGVARYVRASMLEILGQDYVRAARAKGLPERSVVLRHGLRTGLAPIVTLLGLHLPLLLSGAVFVEVVFAWPGMGRTMVEAVLTRDYPVVMAASVLFAVVVLLGNLLADVLYTVVDPRIGHD